MTAKKSNEMTLAAARKMVADADGQIAAAYAKATVAAQTKHQAELDFIKSCTPEQVSMAGLTIGPQTTHDVVYARLKAVVGNG